MSASVPPAQRAAGAARVLLVVAVVAGTFAGWRETWFLVDDAYIAFRYCANAHDGLGFVWNPPPFAPVEGYTSFAWVALLTAIWDATGWEPPTVAPWLSLACGYATLAIGAVAAGRIARPLRGPAVAVALVLLGTVANRTFLTWLSSGLETALFDLLVTWWVVEAVATPRRPVAWSVRLGAAAALAALTRPDGLLFAAATVARLAVEAGAVRGGADSLGGAGEGRASPRALAFGLAPLAVLPVHLAWRHATYGAWLPNTYYAKVTAPWPEAGLRYAASYAIENGAWVWALLAAGWAIAAARGRAARPTAGAWIAVGAVAAHLGYYTLRVGGDHFEYRVYAYLPLLLLLSAAWMVAGWRGWRGPAALAAFVAASLPIGWVHWARTGHAPFDGQEHHALVTPVADAFPAPVRPLVAEFDALQAWLLPRYVGVRHHEHRLLVAYLQSVLPSREAGAAIPAEARAVLPIGSVGVAGWVLPHVVILDAWGLNDRVIARAGVVPAGERKMGHERVPPPGYIDCFGPNVEIGESGVRVHGRPPLDDARIVACETHDWSAPPAP